MVSLSSRRSLALAAVAACFAVLPSDAASQEVGVKAGINSTSLTPLEDEDPDTSRRIGPIAGLWVRLPTGNPFSFQIEGLYSEKGVKYHVLGIDSEVSLRYIEIPLLARGDYGAAGSPVRGFVVGGAAPAFKVSARAKATFDGQEQARDFDDEVYTFDAGLVIGGGVEFGRALVEARYTHGLLHINTDDNGDEDRVRNRVFSVLFGVRFR